MSVPYVKGSEIEFRIRLKDNNGNYIVFDDTIYKAIYARIAIDGFSDYILKFSRDPKAEYIPIVLESDNQTVPKKTIMVFTLESSKTLLFQNGQGILSLNLVTDDDRLSDDNWNDAFDFPESVFEIIDSKTNIGQES